MVLQLHILDILSRDQTVLAESEEVIEVEFLENEESDDDEDFKQTHKKQYGKSTSSKKPTERTAMILHIFGSTSTGQSVRIDVKSFRPYFYIRLPSTISNIQAKATVVAYLKDNLPKHFLKAGITFTIEQREVLYGYTGGALFPFLKITMPSLKCYRAVRSLFLNPDTLLPKTQGYVPLFPDGDPKVYEANLDPMLRFLHLQDLAPCGWAEFETLDLTDLEKEGSILVGECEWSEIVPCEAPITNPCAPFLIASWDMECYSKSGAFTLPRKTFANVIEPLLDISKSPADFGKLFIDAIYNGNIELIAPIPKIEIISAYVLSIPFLRIVEEYLKKANYLKGSAKAAEIGKVGSALDKGLGKRPKGDPVIQIGVVLQKLGSTEPQQKYIFVVGSCSPVEGATVHSFKDNEEAKMLIAFCNFIGLINPDILTGYNVFGYDERYFWGRAEELGLVKNSGWDLEVNPALMAFSRLAASGGSVRLEEKFLSSAALGDNFMYVILMQGRLQIDLFNYIKRSFNLPSYKLDEVTKYFMSGKFTMINGTILIRMTVGKKMANEVGVGRSVVFLDDLGESITGKLRVVEIDGDDLILDAKMLDDDTKGIIADHAIKWVVVKDDVSAKELFRLHRGSAEDRAIIAKYCIQDCVLVLDLFKKLDVFNNAMSMANVCSVPINYIFSRGQGIKCESLIFKFCHKKNQTIEVLPTPAGGFGGKPQPQIQPQPHKQSGHNDGEDDNEDDGVKTSEPAIEEESSYEGAYVMEPKAAFHTESPIGVCDFASLYPSSILSENISHDTLESTRDFTEDGNLIVENKKESVYCTTTTTPVPFIDIEFDILRPDPADTRKHPTKIKMGTRVCRYAQGKIGTVPEIIKGLLAKRKAIRNQMKNEKDPFRLALMDAEQNAYKITANSLYGQLGSRTFKVRLQDLAASVTAYARKQIGFAKAVIERFYGADATHYGHTTVAEVVYGDSVASYTPVIIRRNGLIEIIPICKLAPNESDWKWVQEGEGEGGEGGEEKEYYRPEGIESWTENGWTPIQTIMRHKLSPTKNIVRVVTDVGIVDVTDDHSLIRDTGDTVSPKELNVGDRLLHHEYPPMPNSHTEFQKVYPVADIPLCILNGSVEMQRSFWNGFYYTDNSKDTYDIFVNQNQQALIAQLAFIAENIGYKISLHAHPDKPHIYTLTFTTQEAQQEATNTIKQIYTLSEPEVKNNGGNGYVYDLTTANHHFQAGVGKLIVHNTDSLFINFGLKTVEETITTTELAGKFISSVLKPPHDFEFDKVYWPFLIFSKKRYVGNKYEDSPTKYELAYMGVALKRRDYAPIVKTFYKGVIKLLMDTATTTTTTDTVTTTTTTTGKNSIQAAISFVRDCAMRLVEGKYGLGQLIISKSLGASYSNPPAHKILADRIATRNPGSAPAPGDRIDFIYVAPPIGQLTQKSQGERIETPDYLREHKLTPDYLFYIEHQIANPICQIFGLLLESFPEMNGITIPKDAKRETIAYHLLFDKALQVYAQHKKETFGSLFKIPTQQTTNKIIADMLAPNPIKSSSRMTSITITKNSNTKSNIKQKTVDDYFATTQLVIMANKKKTAEKAAENRLKKKELKEKE